jgi:phosphoglycolate phosphatase
VTRLVVFDCDGTLVDSRAWIVGSVREAFLAEGLLPPADDAIARIVGRSLYEALADLHPEGDPARWTALVETYRGIARRLRAGGDIHEPLFPGAQLVLERLDGAGRLLGIATGKNMAGLRHVLAGHGLEDMFVTLQTADVNPSKPHPGMVERAMEETGSRPHETVVVGDTTFDVLMARGAGARAIGVAWGNHPAAELIEAGAELVLTRFEELLEILEP